MNTDSRRRRRQSVALPEDASADECRLNADMSTGRYRRRRRREKRNGASEDIVVGAEGPGASSGLVELPVWQRLSAGFIGTTCICCVLVPR